MSKIKIFLGGGVSLLHGNHSSSKGYRSDVVDPIISQLNSAEFSRDIFIVKDYSDLTREVGKDQHQVIYNRYIAKESKIALFIIDGSIGSITKSEIEVSVASTRKHHHPIVYIYGKNVTNEEIISYLNQEGIYYQHFTDNADLSSKIKTDLQHSLKEIKQRKLYKFISIILSLIILASLGWYLLTFEDKPIENCTSQLYLMRYYEVNDIYGGIFKNSELSKFKYEDSIKQNKDIAVFPVINSDSLVYSIPPYFRLKINNKSRKTIVFREAYLEIDHFKVNTTNFYEVIQSTKVNLPDINTVSVNDDNNYKLPNFRFSVAPREPEDRYYFTITSNYNCTFRMRLKAVSENNECLYSNYIYLQYIK